MKRVAVATAVALGAALVVLLGPAQLRPWECREVRSAPTARAALDVYYASCTHRPTVEATFDGPSGSGQVDGGHDEPQHVVEFRVRYDGPSGIRFLLVGQQHPGGPWRPLQHEGTGP